MNIIHCYIINELKFQYANKIENYDCVSFFHLISLFKKFLTISDHNPVHEILWFLWQQLKLVFRYTPSPFNESIGSFKPNDLHLPKPNISNESIWMNTCDMSNEARMLTCIGCCVNV